MWIIPLALTGCLSFEPADCAKRVQNAERRGANDPGPSDEDDTAVVVTDVTPMLIRMPMRMPTRMRMPMRMRMRMRMPMPMHF